MNDTISRQAAFDELKAMYRAAEKWGEETSDDTIKIRSESCMASLVEMKLRIEKLPSAQPERKVGKWIDEGTNYFCSECYRGCWVKSDYCPWCGARMEGEEDAE